MATPLSAAAATTRTKTHANARLPFRTVFSRRRWVLLAGHRRFAALLPLLSKFREISWGEVFSRKEERGDDDDETKCSSSPNELFFSAAKFFFVGRNFWREQRTRQIFFSFLSLIAEGWVSNGRENEFFEIEKAIFSYSFLFCRGLYFETMFHVEKRISGCRTGTKRRIFQRLGLGKRVGKF